MGSGHLPNLAHRIYMTQVQPTVSKPCAYQEIPSAESGPLTCTVLSSSEAGWLCPPARPCFIEQGASETQGTWLPAAPCSPSSSLGTQEPGAPCPHSLAPALKPCTSAGADGATMHTFRYWRETRTQLCEVSAGLQERLFICTCRWEERGSGLPLPISDSALRLSPLSLMVW